MAECALEEAVSLWVQLRLNVLVLLLDDLLRLAWDLLLRQGVTLLLLLWGKLVILLSSFPKLRHTVLVRVAGLVLDAHFRPLTVLGHGLGVLVALVAEL